ncbi:MAG TPA: lipid II flippase MurJ [Candidatus Paceibacterota bacterium]
MIKKESILRGSTITIAFNVISKTIGFLSSLLIAYYFGANFQTDVFYFTSSFIALVSIIIISQQTTVFMPLFINIRNTVSEIEAWKFANTLFTLTIIISALFGILFYLFGSNILLKISNFKQDVIIQTSNYIKYFAVIFFLMSIVEFMRAIIQSYSQFTLPALAALANSVLMIICIVFFGRRIGVESMAIAIMFSYIVQAILMLIYLKSKIKYFKIEFNKSPYLKGFVKLGVPVFIAQIFGSLSMFFYDFTSSLFDGGTLTSLSYGQRIADIPNLMIIVPLATVIVPAFSKLRTKNDNNLLEYYYKHNNFLWFLIIPISTLLIVLSFPIIKIFYLRGNFTIESAAIAKDSLIYYSVSLIGAAFVAINTRLIYSIQKTKLISLSSIVVGILSMILTYFMGKYIGYIGIPVSRSISLIFLSLPIGIFLSYHYFTDFKLSRIFIPLSKMICLSFVGALITYVICNFVQIKFESSSILLSFFEIAEGTIIYSSIYFLGSSFLKLEQFYDLRKLFLKFKSKLLINK